jgi:putative membrane protein
MDDAHKMIHDDLMNRSGYSFDSLYMSSQVSDHQMAKTLFESEASGGTEQQLKNYAAKYVPHITEHLEKADSIKSVMIVQQGQ